jgi:hypothetical protein
MKPVIYRAPVALHFLLLAGAVALGLLGLSPAFAEFSRSGSIVCVGIATGLVLYALSLGSSKLVLSDEGLSQKLLASEFLLRWEDIVEWRHCEGGSDFETGESRDSTMNKHHFIEFWLQDTRGKRYYLKRWLVFGKRSRLLADVLRQKGIQGG